MMRDFRDAQASNKRRTVVLLSVMFALVVGSAWALVQLYAPAMAATVIPVAVGVALIGVWGSYWHADKLVLAMTRARVVAHDDAPQLYNLVEEMTIAAGLPMPKVAIVEDAAPNAFATGRDPDHAVVAFTTGILALMDRDQLQGVAAHELAHVANRDTLVSAVAATTAGLLVIISDIGLRVAGLGGRKRGSGGGGPVALIAVAFLILAPLGAVLLRAAVSRKRESLADATAVALTRNPTGLRRALEALADDSTVVRARNKSLAHLWIESPLDGRAKSLFNTHPTLNSRINALALMESVPQYREG